MGDGLICLGRVGVVLVLALLPALFAPPSAGASADGQAEVTEFHLGEEDLFPRAIAATPDGRIWFIDGKARRTVSYERHYRTVIARLGADGGIEEFKPPSIFAAFAIAPGPEGNVWYLTPRTVGGLTATGTFTGFPLERPYSSVGAIAAGPDGNLWVSEGKEILRVGPDGQVRLFPLPDSEPGVSSIVAGPDGNVWFSEHNTGRIGRVTPEGRITRFPVHGYPGDIAAGPDGNLWFTELGPNRLGRITPSGRITKFHVPRGGEGPLAGGPDGRIWFPTGLGQITRITPSGRLSRVELPFVESDVTDLTSAPDGALWYTAIGDRPCFGGGGSCQVWQPDNPGIVGRIAPGARVVRTAAAEIARPRARAGRGRAAIPLWCPRVASARPCRGVVRLTAALRPRSAKHRRRPPAKRNVLLAVARYRLAPGKAEPVELRLGRRTRRLLARLGRLRATATLSRAGAVAISERIVVQR